MIPSASPKITAVMVATKTKRIVTGIAYANSD